jgi:hypothetical protein
MSKRIQATDVRQSLLDVAPSLIETADLLARGELKDYEGNAQMLQALLRLVSPIVSLEDDRVAMDNMKPEYTTEERVDTITRAMVEGTISLNQAKSMVDVLQRTSDIQDAAAIKTALEKLAESV